MTRSRGWVLAIGTGLLGVAGAHALVAAAMLRPWFAAEATMAHGEVWFLVAGSLDLAVAVLGASLVRAGLERPRHSPPEPASRPRLYDGVNAEDEQTLRRQDALLQDMVTAKLAIELDQPQMALDALSPAISHLSRSVTQGVVREASLRPPTP
jgi:hypothetical protein